MERRVPLFLKLAIIFSLVLVMVIALWQVESVISDRQGFRNQAVEAITSSYASNQRIIGAVLVQPYSLTTHTETTNAKGGKSTETQTSANTLKVFPRQLDIHGVLNPSVRRHGLYRVTVYEFQGTIQGHIDVPQPAIHGDIKYGEPYLAFHISDVRGIVGRPTLNVNGEVLPMQGALKTQSEIDSLVQADVTPGTNLRALLPGFGGKSGNLDFSLNLTLAGTQSLELVPLADNNHFDLSSSWTAPLFAGKFLPRSREVGPTGFHAIWDISSLASATQQQISAQSDNVDVVSTSLTDLIDPYRLADRAAKYGILFILLTFSGFFLFELIRQMLIHPIQYLLVGFCLTIFFLLLVSLSERMSFGVAYLVSSVACIGLLTHYLVFVLRSTTYGLEFGGMLTALYAAIYGLLVSEDNALLLGSFMLFFILAAIMIATRKIDWYQRTRGTSSSDGPKGTSSHASPFVPSRE